MRNHFCSASPQIVRHRQGERRIITYQACFYSTETSDPKSTFARPTLFAIAHQVVVMLELLLLILEHGGANPNEAAQSASLGRAPKQ